MTVSRIELPAAVTAAEVGVGRPQKDWGIRNTMALLQWLLRFGLGFRA